jgi:hypothetical protein
MTEIAGMGRQLDLLTERYSVKGDLKAEEAGAVKDGHGNQENKDE